MFDGDPLRLQQGECVCVSVSESECMILSVWQSLAFHETVALCVCSCEHLINILLLWEK